MGLRPPVVAVTAAAAPFALCVATRRTPARDVATCTLQMWAYLAAYQMPHDDPEALERRVHISYPVFIDTVLGGGIPPTLRLQRRFARAGLVGNADQVLIWAHWLWFLVPHTAMVYVLARDREHFGHHAALMYATFDIGLIGYWALPTAPPWYAAERDRLAPGRELELRRLMYEHGVAFFKGGWRPLYAFLGGNPLAAMPSLHFATSLMAAHILSEVGPVEGAVGWTYTLTLGFALVYLGEHYLVDLLAGLALTEGIRAAAPRAAPALVAVSRVMQRLEARAHA